MCLFSAGADPAACSPWSMVALLLPCTFCSAGTSGAAVWGAATTELPRLCSMQKCWHPGLLGGITAGDRGHSLSSWLWHGKSSRSNWGWLWTSLARRDWALLWCYGRKWSVINEVCVAVQWGKSCWNQVTVQCCLNSSFAQKAAFSSQGCVWEVGLTR